MRFFRRSALRRFQKETNRIQSRSIEELRASVPPEIPQEYKEIQFLWVCLLATKPDEIVKMRSDIGWVIERSGGYIEQLAGPLIAGTFGLLDEHPVPSDMSRQREQAITKITEIVGCNAAVLHGAAKALVGDLGNETLSRFGSVMVRHREMLGLLCRLGPGEVYEWGNSE